MLKTEPSDVDCYQKEKISLENQLENAKVEELKDKIGLIVRLSEIYYQLDLKSEYKAFLEKFVNPLGLEYFTNSSNIMFFVGLGFFQQFDYEKSNFYIKKSLEVNPQNYKALNTLACIICEQDPSKKKEQIDYLKQVLKIKEDYYRAHFNIATAYEDINDFENAEYHYKRSIELNSNLFKLYYSYIYFLQSFNRLDEALEIIKQIEVKFTQNDQVYDIYQLYFQSYFELNQYDVSLKYCQMSIDIDPEQFCAYVNKGNALFGLGQYEEAIEQIKIGIQKKLKDNTKSKEFLRCNIEYYNIGLSYLQLNQINNAIQSFEKSIREDNSYSNSYKQIMKIYLTLHNYEGFLEMFEKSVQNTKRKNKSLILSFVMDHGFQVSVSRIENCMQKIVLSDVSNYIILRNIYDKMKLEISINQQHSKSSKRYIYLEIYQLLSEKYLRISQTLSILISYNKNIKNNICFQQKYSIWDLLID